MKRYGICYQWRFCDKMVAFVDSSSEQTALNSLLYCVGGVGFPSCLCIHNVVEWKGEAQGDPNGQYILTAA